MSTSLSNSVRHLGCSAFSLIELMVTITIIALLASLLMVTASMVRTMARTATCASNLGQIGIASLAYSQDWRGFAVTTVEYCNGCNRHAATSPWWENTHFFAERLRDYIGARENATNGDRVDNVFRCPENTITSLNLDNPCNYAKSPWTGLSSHPTFVQWWPAVRWAHFGQVSQTIIMSDSIDQRLNGGPAQNSRELCDWIDPQFGFGLGFFHNKASNILYGDAHVERKTWSQVPMNRLPMQPNFYNTPGNDSGYPTWQPWTGVSYIPGQGCYGFNR